MTDTAALASIIVIVIIGAAVAVRRRDIMYPPLVFATPLAVEYGFYFAFFRTTLQVRPETNALFVLSLCCFLVGCQCVEFASLFVKQRAPRERINIDLGRFQSATRLCMFLGLLGFVWGLFSAARIGLAGGSGFFNNLRVAATSSTEGVKLGPATYLLLFLHVIALVGLCNRQRYRWKTSTVVGLFVLLLASAAFTVARTAIFQYFISVAGVYLLSNRYIHFEKLNKKIVLGSAGLFVVLMLLFATLTNKLEAEGQPYLITYIGYPVVAFDRWILPHEGNTGGANLFAPFAKLFSVLGIASLPDVNLSDYGLTDSDFNVFTYMVGPYLDYGAAGLYAAMLIIGGFYGWMYARVRSGDPTWIMFYGIMLYPLAIAFYGYQFSLTLWLYYLAILFGIKWTHRAKPAFDRLPPAEGINSVGPAGVPAS